MKDILLNDNTCAVIATYTGSKIIKKEGCVVSELSPREIINKNCEYFGSSLDGRQKGTQNLIGITHKVPIIIEESHEIIFFPTMSPRIDKCSWFALKNISKIYTDNNKNYVLFKNNISIETDISFGILNNQLLRATRLESVIRNRKLF